MTWHIMEHVSLPLPALLWPLLTLTALATETHRDLKIFSKLSPGISSLCLASHTYMVHMYYL